MRTRNNSSARRPGNANLKNNAADKVDYASGFKMSSLTRRRLVALSLTLICITFALYWSVRSQPFADYDDDNYVTANANVQSGLNWKSVSWALTSTEKSNWHPLTWISHELDCQIYGLNPAGHHLTNLGLHAINVVLLFLVLTFLTNAMEQSFLVALLFAVHPLNVESVAWIAERKNLLSTAFFLIAIGTYTWYTHRPSPKRYLLLCATFVLGLASKPMVITLPCVLLLLDYWPLRRVLGAEKPFPQFPAPKMRLSQLFLEKMPLFLLAAGSAVLTIFAQNSGGSIESLTKFSLGVRIENAVWAYAEYIWKFFSPARLAPVYPHPGNSLVFWKVLLGAILTAAISAFVWRKRSHKYLVIGWCWFLGTLVPVIGLIQVGNQAIADRYMYIPIIGLLVILVWGALELAQRENLKFVPRMGLAALIVVGLSWLSHRQIGFWKTSYDLWSHTLVVTENNSVAENNLGVALMKLGRDDEGLAHFLNAQRIDPQDPTGRLNAAAVLQRHGQLQQAKAEYLSVIELVSVNSNAVANAKLLTVASTNLGTIYSETGEYDKARETYREALDINPKALDSLIDQFYQFVIVQPNGKSYLWLAELLEQAGRTSEARVSYARALNFDPTLTEAQTSLERLKLLQSSSLSTFK
jgi:tetratricopeptide (TPR) repeat protein